MSTKASPNYSEHTGAKGGGQLGRSRDFMKEPDAFREDKGPGAEQNYGSKGAPAKRTGDKELKTIKPRC